MSRITKRQKWLITIGCLVGLYTVLGFWVLPAIIKSQLHARLPALTHRQVSIAAVRLNPYALSFTLRGLKLTEDNGDEFASLGELYANFQLSSVVRRTWTFREIRITAPALHVLLDTNGVLNVANLAPTHAPPSESTTTSTEVPSIWIGKLIVADGRWWFTDRSGPEPFDSRLQPINVTLENFRTQRDTRNPYAFNARAESGESLTWAGDLSVNPPRSHGHLEIRAIKLPKYQPYFSRWMGFAVTSGLIDIAGDYEIDATATPLAAALTNGTIQLTNLQLGDPRTGATVAGFEGLTIAGISARLADQRARISRITMTNGQVSARLRPSGEVDLVQLATRSPRHGDSPPGSRSLRRARRELARRC